MNVMTDEAYQYLFESRKGMAKTITSLKQLEARGIVDNSIYLDIQKMRLRAEELVCDMKILQEKLREGEISES